MTIFILEPYGEERERPLITSRPISVRGTRFFWLNAPLMAALGVAVAYAVPPVDGTGPTLLAGLIYGVLIVSASVVHSLGHVATAHVIAAPVAYVRLSATVSTVACDDARPWSPTAHVVREVGGPGANLVVGATALGLRLSLLEDHFIAFAAGVNLLFGLMTLLPVPSLDGASILRVIARSRPQR